MTTGPQHYAEAERLARLAMDDRSYPETSYAVLAQVHATLALAAATALGQRDIRDDADSYSTDVLPSDDYQAWWRAASEGPGARQRRREAELAEQAEDQASTAEWFAASKADGCTGTGYDAGNDSIAHEGELPCPVHPGL